MALFLRFLRDDKGATAIEYGLIAAVVSIVILTAVTRVGKSLNVKFTNISNALN